jgi:copper(I)-binding protein
VALASGAGGHGHTQIAAESGIKIEGAFARASAGPVRNGAAYLTITNTGGAADRLIGAEADVSTRVELHTHRKEGEVMRMRKVEAIDVPAGGTATLQPGGNHVMFMGLKEPLKEGESFPLTLMFETAGSIEVMVTVGPAGAMRPESGHGGGHGGGHGHQGGHGMHKTQ